MSDLKERCIAHKIQHPRAYALGMKLGVVLYNLRHPIKWLKR